MRKPEIWLAAAMYDTARRAMPSICNNMGCRIVCWPIWDEAPLGLRELFIEFAKGVLAGVSDYLEESGNAVTKSEAEREQGGEETSDG